MLFLSEGLFCGFAIFNTHLVNVFTKMVGQHRYNYNGHC